MKRLRGQRETQKTKRMTDRQPESKTVSVLNFTSGVSFRWPALCGLLKA